MFLQLFQNFPNFQIHQSFNFSKTSSLRYTDSHTMMFKSCLEINYFEMSKQRMYENKEPCRLMCTIIFMQLRLANMLNYSHRLETNIDMENSFAGRISENVVQSIWQFE